MVSLLEFGSGLMRFVNFSLKLFPRMLLAGFWRKWSALPRISSSELLLEAIRADILLLESERQVLHFEFQTQPNSAMAFRMLDYWGRLYRRLSQ